jgi:nitrogen fixation/metabolism regulation signal transduction histidine kinase
LKLRWRLVIALAIAGLLPLFPLLVAVKTVVGVGTRALAPEAIGTSLQDGLSIARDHLNEIKDMEEFHLEELSRNILLPNTKTNSSRVSKLDSLETLYLSVNDIWYRYSDYKWVKEKPAYAQQNSNFQNIPNVIVVEKTAGSVIWRLERKVSEDFISRAGQIQESIADWALRAMDKDRLIASLLGTYLITYLIAVIMAVSGGLLVVVPATRKIEQLTGIADAVRLGDEQRRAPDFGHGEIGQLASTFNLMVDRLDESRKKAADMEKMAAWRETARVLAHEIKNPLTPIQLSVQQISDTYEGDNTLFAQQLATTREIVDEEVESLRKLVREFSEFARAPKLEISRSDVLQLLNDMKSLYGERLEIQTTQSELFSMLDKEKVKRAIINLLDNGLAETGPEGRLRLGLKCINDQLIFVVEDSGNGVPSDKRSTIFEPYFTTKNTGVGLGLPIVKTTCEQHGGSISVTDSEELGGAKFIIKIPHKTS